MDGSPKTLARSTPTIPASEILILSEEGLVHVWLRTNLHQESVRELLAPLGLGDALLRIVPYGNPARLGRRPGIYLCFGGLDSLAIRTALCGEL